jgi:hypothetical protein
MRARIAMAMAFAICGVAAGPALADNDHHKHNRGHSGHEWHDRGWHDRPYFYSSAPNVYYAPPPVIYTPAYPSAGINFVFPLWIH